MPRARGPLKIEPLWMRIERNRLKLVVFLAAFLAAWALAFVLVFWGPAVIVLSAVAAFGVGMARDHWLVVVSSWVLANLPLSALAVACSGIVASAIYAAVTLAQPLRKQLAALGVRRVAEEHRETRSALREMVLAAGYADLQPELFVLDSYAVNAFAIARGSERAFIVVTAGLLKQFDADEQRAVFAHLLARVRAGDVQWATTVSALLAPIWRWRDVGLQDRTTLPFNQEGERVEEPRPEYSDAYLRLVDEYPFLAGDQSGLSFAASRVARGSRKRESSELEAAAALTGVPLFGPLAWITYAAAVIASELVAQGHRRSQLLSAEVADAEGMLLLKDPADMLRALRHAIDSDNRIRLAQPLYAQLFYVWAGDDLTDEEDPDWERLDRLQEVVGVDGVADAARDTLGPAADPVDIGAPVAPRLGVAGAAAPTARAEYFSVPVWASVGVPGVVAVVVTMAATGRLITQGWARPVTAPAGSAAWIAYGEALRSGEVRALWIAAAAALVAGAVSGRTRWGALIGSACAGTLLIFDALGRSLAPGDLGVAAPLFASGAAGAVVAGMLGGALGSLLRRRVGG